MNDFQTLRNASRRIQATSEAQTTEIARLNVALADQGDLLAGKKGELNWFREKNGKAAHGAVVSPGKGKGKGGHQPKGKGPYDGDQQKGKGSIVDTGTNIFGQHLNADGKPSGTGKPAEPIIKGAPRFETQASSSTGMEAPGLPPFHTQVINSSSSDTASMELTGVGHEHYLEKNENVESGRARIGRMKEWKDCRHGRMRSSNEWVKGGGKTGTGKKDWQDESFLKPGKVFGVDTEDDDFVKTKICHTCRLWYPDVICFSGSYKNGIGRCRLCTEWVCGATNNH